jgi:hypothetical protein
VGKARKRARYAVALAVLLGLTIWRLQSSDVAAEGAAAPAQRAVTPERSERAPVVLERAADGLPIMPAGSHKPAVDEPLHPHPITAAHLRIYRENNLVGALNLAVDLQDARRIRAALAQYRAEFPEDEHRLQQGYAIIADCLEQLDDATRERAQHFWSTEIRSQTRRYVRRYCLERERAS